MGRSRAIICVGLALFALQVCGIVVWGIWGLVQLSKPMRPEETHLNDVNAVRALTSSYPFVGSCITMIPILEDLWFNCENGTCSTQNKLVWFASPLVSMFVFFILFGSTYELYPAERYSTYILLWNASLLFFTAAWTIWAFVHVNRMQTGAWGARKNGGGGTSFNADVHPESYEIQAQPVHMGATVRRVHL